MKASILDKLESLSQRHEEVGQLLSDPDVIAEQNRFRELSMEYAELEPVVKTYAAYQQVLEDMDAAQLLLDDDDADMRSMGQDELTACKAQREPLEVELQTLLLPKTRMMAKTCFLKFAPEPAAMKRLLFPVICFECTAATLKQKSGG